jgi:copper chaperone CopZ
MNAQCILKVDGMTCTNCARSVENAIEELGGANISVNLAEKEVVFDAAPSLQFELLKSTIEKRGYTVLSDEDALNTQKKN